jgi:solute carrier family 25 folate transporter 32
MTIINPKLEDAPERQNIKHIISGAASGLVTAILVCPLDVVKFRLQASKASLSRNLGTKSTLISIAKREGIPGLFSGLHPTVLVSNRIFLMPRPSH